MKMKLNKVRLSSRKMTLIILAILFIPMTLYIIAYNMTTMTAMNERISNTSKNVLSFYKEAVEFDLNKIELNLAETVANDNNYRKLLNSLNELEAYQASYEIVEKNKTVLKLYPQIMGIYIYSPHNNIFRSSYSEGYRYEQKVEVEEALLQLMKIPEPNKEEWFVDEIGDTWYLFRILGVKQTNVACAVPLEKVLNQNNTAKMEGYTAFSSLEGKAYTEKNFIEEHNIDLSKNQESYYITGEHKNYFVVQSNVEFANEIKLSYIIKYDGIWAMMDHGWIVLTILFLLVMVGGVVCYWILQKVYFRPLVQFVNTMNQIREGGLDTKMNTQYMLKEFKEVSETFNSMVEELKHLKIVTYEKEVENQKVQLQRLQIQIRPHFFLNCLKNLYGMAQEQKYREIQNMIVILSSHCRYILQDTSVTVPLEEEIKSAKNYVELQNSSAAYEVECDFQVETSLQNVLIPQMSILTFVENAVKHATCPNQKLRIYVKVQRLAGEDSECVNISITDNGGGFSEEVLEKMNSVTKEEDMNGHIGIYNVKKRLELLYGKKSILFFANQLQGASVELFIPIDDTNGRRKEGSNDSIGNR